MQVRQILSVTLMWSAESLDRTRVSVVGEQKSVWELLITEVLQQMSTRRRTGQPAELPRIFFWELLTLHGESIHTEYAVQGDAKTEQYLPGLNKVLECFYFAHRGTRLKSEPTAR